MRAKKRQTTIIIRIALCLTVLLTTSVATLAQGSSTHRLFSADVRRLQPSPVYDFLEQALADYQAQRADRQLILKKVQFARGSWNTLATVRPDDECQISILDDRRYVVQWLRGGSELVTLSFPVDYELLSGSTRRQLERSLVSRLRTYRSPAAALHLPSTVDGMTRRSDNLYVKAGASFKPMPKVKGDTYYTIGSNGRPAYVVDRHYPAESLANMLLAAVRPAAVLSLNFLMSDNNHQQANITVGQWFSFSQKEGCTPYYIYEGFDGTTHSAMLVADNPQWGYAHMLHVTCRAEELTADVPNLKAKAYLYIPLANVLDFFARTPKGRSGNKTYK